LARRITRPGSSLEDLAVLVEQLLDFLRARFLYEKTFNLWGRLDKGVVFRYGIGASASLIRSGKCPTNRPTKRPTRFTCSGVVSLENFFGLMLFARPISL